MRYLGKYLKNDINNTNELFNKTKSYFRIPLRIYVNFLIETNKMDEESGRKYLKVIPNRKINPDSFIPSDEQIKKAYQKISESKDKIYFEIALFSGLRLTEITKIIREFVNGK